MGSIYLFFYFVVGYAVFFRKYVPHRLDGILQVVAMPMLSLLAFTSFIFIFSFYIYFWRKFRGSTFSYWCIKYFAFPACVIAFAFPSLQSLPALDKVLVMLLILLVCDWFKFFEKYTMKISIFIAEQYGDHQTQAKFPQKASDLFVYDLMVLASLVGLARL